MPSFNPNKVKKYIDKVYKNQVKSGNTTAVNSSNIFNSIMAFFDKNADGCVTYKEFKSKSRSEYEKYRQSLFNYVGENLDYNNSNTNNMKTDYDLIAHLFQEKDAFCIDDLYIEDVKPKFIKTNTDITEQKHKKDYNHYTPEERSSEQDQYMDESWGEFKSYVSFLDMRKEINIYDENSMDIDWHIGTFNQDYLKSCTILSTLNLLTDDELKDMYKKKTDKNGNVYYEVNFPNDNRKKPIIIYERDIDNGYIELDNNIIRGFSQGDADVTLIEMAYIKRYGTDIIDKGSTRVTAMNRLIKGCDSDLIANPTKELLQNGKRTTAGINDLEWLKQNYNYDEDTRSITLSNGQNIEINVTHASDGDHFAININGTKIYCNHAYSVSSYNPETEEVFITNPHENSTDIPIPFEIFQELFNICQDKSA